MNSLFIGIDVSNKTLDIAYQEDNHWIDYQIENTMESIDVFLQEFDKQQTSFVLEPTGTYSDKLLQALDKSNCSIKLINPQKSSAFMKVLGITTKDDKQAARALAIAGKTLDLPDYQMPNENIQKRKKLQMALNAFEKQERQTKNQIHSIMQCVHTPDVVSEAFQDLLNSIQNNIRKIKQELEAFTDITFDKFKELACSVKGIGEKSAHLLYTYTNGFELFTNHKQLVKFVGTVPLTHQSGTSVYRKGRISKAGPAQIRTVLFNATRAAIRFNKECEELFNRLRAKGKPYKVAKIAVINKLLRQTFAVVKSGVKFQDDYQNKFKEHIE